MKKAIRALGAALGLKGMLSLASMTAIVLALVSYNAVVTITPVSQFTLGSASTSWGVKVNDVDKYRYLPGTGTPAGSSKPANNATNAFTVVTDTEVCAVLVQLTSPVDASKFSKFQITVQRWFAGSWVSEPLYASATGTVTKSYIDGLTAGDVGYIHQPASATTIYLVAVLYSYDMVGATDTITVTFQYAPLP